MIGFSVDETTDPGQAVPAAELPGGDAGGTGVLVQHDVGCLRVGHEVKLPTHCGVASGWEQMWSRH